MSRRTVSLWLSVVLAVGLTFGAAILPVPYVGLVPGPTFNTLGDAYGVPVLKISGRPTRATTGHLDLTTVGVESQLSLFQALGSWLGHRSAVVPRELIYPPGQSDQQVARQNVRDMQASQDAATIAALTDLGLYRSTVTVVKVDPGSPAQGRLRAGDVLSSVDGTPVPDAAGLRRLVSSRKVGAPVRIGYLRRGKPGTVTVRTVRSHDDGPPRPVMGVLTAESKQFLVQVTIALKDVGGPSAGLMFALGIIDKLGTDDLTGGRYIAGTGEIDPDGTVTRIGGIGQKLAGARRNGATVFLVPEGNCAEALQNRPPGLQLVRVASLQDALTQLRLLRTGGSPAPCTG